MPNKIPVEELRRTEAKCNALLGLHEDYRHIISSLEQNYSARISEHRIRKITGGSAGPEEILLEEDGVDHVGKHRTI
jgi:hypothetical protein